MADAVLSDPDVRELIRIAEGSLKERRGYWYTLGIKIDHYFSLDEQLEAVRQLGLSQNPIALDYLRKLNEHHEEDTGMRRGNLYDYMWSDLYDTGAPVTILNYPNANGWLKIKLESSENDEVRNVLSVSLSKLEKSLK